jgi:hypothetical protein
MGGLLLGLGLLVEAGNPARAGPPPDLAAYPWLYQRDNRPLDPAEEVVELMAVGDVMLGRGVAAEPEPLAEVAAWLSAADLAMGNLEAMIVTSGMPQPGLYDNPALSPHRLRAMPSAINHLQAAGFDLLGVANNHALRAAQLLPVWAGPRPRLMTLDEAESLLARVQSSRRLSFTCDLKVCQPVDLTPPVTSRGIFWGGEIDLTGDGIPEKVRRLQEQIVIYSNGAEVWRGDADWQVADLALGDPNDDGRWEAILALWKPDETGVMRSHPFIIGYRKGIYRDIWGGSAVADPIYELELGDVDGDGTQELIVLEATGQAGQRAVTVWDWHGWGFSLRWRSDPGYYRDLVYTPAAASHPSFVAVSVLRESQRR